MDQFAFTLVLDFGSIISGIFWFIVACSILRLILAFFEWFFGLFKETPAQKNKRLKRERERKKAQDRENARTALAKELQLRYPEIKEAVTKKQLEQKQKRKKLLLKRIKKVSIIMAFVVILECVFFLVFWSDSANKASTAFAIMLFSDVALTTALMLIDK